MSCLCPSGKDDELETSRDVVNGGDCTPEKVNVDFNLLFWIHVHDVGEEVDMRDALDVGDSRPYRLLELCLGSLEQIKARDDVQLV